MNVNKCYLCVALLCLLTIGGCGKGPEDSKPKPDNSAGKKEKPEAPKATSIAVTGEKLTEDFKANKEEAEKKYWRKTLEIEAVVKDVFQTNGYVTFKAAPGMELQSTEFGSDFLKQHPEIASGKTIKFQAKLGIVTDTVVNVDEPKLITQNPPK